MLTDYQKSTARHDGGKKLANRKSHLARVGSALHSLIAAQDTTAADGLTAEDRQILASAAAVVDRLTRALAGDVRDAKRIKTEYDRRCHAATQALRALVSTPADTVALAALAEPRRNFDDVATEYERMPRWAKPEVETLLRDAVAILADRIALRMTDREEVPTAQIAALAADLPAARERHAEVIRRIQAVLVQAEMERAA